MPCSYAAVKIKAKAKNRNTAAQKKKAIFSALSFLGFALSLKPSDKEQLFLLGEKDGKQIEVLIDRKTGKFVTHFSGVPTHGEEHQILDSLLLNLKKLGYESKVDHYHDRPKLPELQENKTYGLRIKEGETTV